MHIQSLPGPKPAQEEALLHIWLTGRVSDLMTLSSTDLERACREFDMLVWRWGTERVGRALETLTQDFKF